MLGDFNYQNFVQLACSACHMVIHTVFCSYNEKQKYSPIIFLFRKYKHGYLACENSCLSTLFHARDVWQNVPSGEKRRLLSQANGYFTYLGIQLCQFV